MALPTVHVHIVMKEHYGKYGHDEHSSPHKNCAVCHRAEEKSGIAVSNPSV